MRDFKSIEPQKSLFRITYIDELKSKNFWHARKLSGKQSPGVNERRLDPICVVKQRLKGRPCHGGEVDERPIRELAAVLLRDPAVWAILKRSAAKEGNREGRDTLN